MTRPVTLYRYGWIAWVWRVLATLCLLGAAIVIFLAARFELWSMAPAAIPLALPSLFFPYVLAVRIDLVDRDEVVVTNLWFVRRRIHRASFGPARVKKTAQGAITHIAAPRAWIPVQGSLPVYLDLYAEIPDEAALRAFFRFPSDRKL